MIKGILQFSEIAKAVFSTPLKFLFGIRGGYRGMASRAVSTSNVFLKSANMLQLMFGVWTPKIDHVIEILNIPKKKLSRRNFCVIFSVLVSFPHFSSISFVFFIFYSRF